MIHALLSRLVSPSTRAFVAEARLQGTPWRDIVHGYVYARWPYLYIGIGTGEHWLARVLAPFAALISRLLVHPPSVPQHQDDLSHFHPHDHVTFADTYHGKVVPLPAATQLVTQTHDVTLTDLEHVIPYAIARDIILRHPDHIAVLDCPCRMARAKPCLPLDVCLIVGEPFASFVVDHHTHHARWITADAAVNILGAEDARGHVHHAFFKDAMLGRFYAICNCCACCCGAMQAQRSGIRMLASSGYLSQADPDRCVSCGVCELTCQFKAITVDGAVTIDTNDCMGCGVCVNHCPTGALTLVRDPSRPAPLELDVLLV